jgi:SWI/SNF-related matrix-associated actin-dependent regulator 1 of chromatin subfamily A
LDPENWPKKTWFHFGQRYGAAIFNGFGWKYTGSAHLDELSCQLRATVMLRRTKAEVLPELPPKFRTVIEIDPVVSDDQIREAVAAELDAFERFEIAVKKLKYPGKDEIDNLAEARHKTAIAKVGYIDSFVSETLNAGCQKLVLWIHHRDVAQALHKRLEKFNPVILLGGMTPKQRTAAMESFQTDPSVRVFIGSISACGVGITLTAASHCVFAELSWTPSDLTQCEDRCHRIGQRDNVLVQHIVLRGSLDSIMAKVLLKKQRIMDAVLDSPKASLIGAGDTNIHGENR